MTTNEKGEEKPKEDKLDNLPLPEGTDTNDFVENEHPSTILPAPQGTTKPPSNFLTNDYVEKEHPSTILPPPQGTTRPPGNFSSGYSDYIKNYNIE